MASFPSIRIEGGLLGPDVLDQLLSASLPGQKPADFGVSGRRTLTDEIAAVFTDARALWGVFQHRLQRLPETDLATTVTRDAWLIPFLGLLGYEPRFNQRAYDVDGQSFAISHRAGEPEDSPPLHMVGARQELGRVPASGRPRLAPHSLLQELLNRTEHVWGVVTNGRTLRLLRDCTLVRRQAYLEFDLQAIVEEQRFQDFAALYRLLHRSRLPRGAADGDDCLLEKYYAHSVEQGGRVREHLRDGVEQCITLLANGFLHHSDNDELRRLVSQDYTDNNRITADGLYRQLLRLVYRFLFLLVSEDRGLLSADPLYREHYGVARLRQLIEQQIAWTDHDDLWQSLRVLWFVLTSDTLQPSFHNQPMAAALGLPVLNGELFAEQPLDGFTISNHDLLEAFWNLTWYQERSSQSRRVNYAALDVEELGSVYESLLELHPAVHRETAGRFTFELVAAGRERRATGSHYTPPELVAPLIRHALEPVLAERLREASTRERKELAILSLKVCDPACGSGHFLLAAARHLGKELARVRTGEDEPAPERVREAIRDVATRCIYGVDKNPLAVELCRVSLWLESHEGGKPLTFLDHRIRCGDSLVGVLDLETLAAGIPDGAFKPVGGDDKATAREAKRRNAEERRHSLLNVPFADQLAALGARLTELDRLPEDTIEQVRAKADACRDVENQPEFRRLKAACHAWTAAFFQQFRNHDGQSLTTEHLRSALRDGELHHARLDGFVLQNALERGFFHWPLAFPEVFAAGGFDAILGNPPFMGGLRISGEFGEKYRNWLVSTMDCFAGNTDLCAVFFRRAFQAIKPAGRFGMIATNTIGQGDTRQAGLAHLVHNGGAITFARRFVKWPGTANVEVTLLALTNGPASAPSFLDGEPAPAISSRLDSLPEAEPGVIAANRSLCFQGSIVLGKGFILTPAEAESIVARSPKSAECLFPYLTGEDINNSPSHEPSRWVLQFDELSETDARRYTELWAIATERVLPERRDKDADKYPRMVHEWWKHWNNRQELYGRVRPLRRAMARSRVSEFHMLSWVRTDIIYSDACVVFALDDDFHFAVLQSAVHEAWLRREASTMRTDVRYTPTDCFSTFPLPRPVDAARARVEEVGRVFYELRRGAMLARSIGFTELYNMIHDSQCADADIASLREAMMELDRAVLGVYGWSDITCSREFTVDERGRDRYLVSHTDRDEMIRRVTRLNLEYSAN